MYKRRIEQCWHDLCYTHFNFFLPSGKISKVNLLLTACRHLLLVFLFLITIFSSKICFAQQRSYEVPPSESTTFHVPVISDEQMEKCVKVYNENKWLDEEISGMNVNLYSRREVDNYNRKVTQLNKMVDWFNINCANKQSYSACKATQKINKEKGLPVQPCR